MVKPEHSAWYRAGIPVVPPQLYSVGTVCRATLTGTTVTTARSQFERIARWHKES